MLNSRMYLFIYSNNKGLLSPFYILSQKYGTQRFKDEYKIKSTGISTKLFLIKLYFKILFIYIRIKIVLFIKANILLQCSVLTFVTNALLIATLRILKIVRQTPKCGICTSEQENKQKGK